MITTANNRKDRVRAMLADLKMLGALEVIDGILAQADSGATTAREAIKQLLDAQIVLRNNRRLETAMRSSRLPVVKTLAQFDFSFQPSIKREQIESLHEGCSAKRIHADARDPVRCLLRRLRRQPCRSPRQRDQVPLMLLFRVDNRHVAGVEIPVCAGLPSAAFEAAATTDSYKEYHGRLAHAGRHTAGGCDGRRTVRDTGRWRSGGGTAYAPETLRARLDARGDPGSTGTRRRCSLALRDSRSRRRSGRRRFHERTRQRR